MTAEELRRRVEEYLKSEAALSAHEAMEASEDALIAVERNVPGWQGMKWESLRKRLQPLVLQKAIDGPSRATAVGTAAIAGLAEAWSASNMADARDKAKKDREKRAYWDKELYQAAAKWLVGRKPDLEGHGAREFLAAELARGTLEYRDDKAEWRALPKKSIATVLKYLAHFRSTSMSPFKVEFREGK